jgi:CBS domain-containing protein
MRLAADLMREAPTIRPEDTLEDGVALLAAGDDEGIPVIDTRGNLVGWLTHRRVLRAYRRGAGMNGGTRNGGSDQGTLERYQAYTAKKSRSSGER